MDSADVISDSLFKFDLPHGRSSVCNRKATYTNRDVTRQSSSYTCCKGVIFRCSRNPAERVLKSLRSYVCLSVRMNETAREQICPVLITFYVGGRILQKVVEPSHFSLRSYNFNDHVKQEHKYFAELVSV
jgi:hypothetical protein